MLASQRTILCMNNCVVSNRIFITHGRQFRDAKYCTVCTVLYRNLRSTVLQYGVTYEVHMKCGCLV